MLTSSKGSAVAEFLMLVAPMVLCISGTAQVSWAGYAKSQLRIIASTAAFAASQPDTEVDEILRAVEVATFKKLKTASFASISSEAGIVQVDLQLSAGSPLSLISGLVPMIKVSSHAATEI